MAYRRRRRFTPRFNHQTPGGSLMPPGVVHTDRYHSWGAFLDRAAGKTDMPAPASVTGDSWFCQTQTHAEALGLALHGWPEGAARASELSSGLFQYASQLVERTEYHYDVTGGALDFGRYFSGEPECWQTEETLTESGTGRRIVRIVYNGSASAGISTQVMEAKGAAIVALAQLLDYAGHGSEITLAYGQCNDGRTAESYVTIKTPDQPLDLSRVAFALAHPSCYRRLFFRVMERWEPKIRQTIGVGNGYGYPVDVTDRGDLYVDCSHYNSRQWTDPQTARTWVLSQLEAQGVSLS